MRFSLPARVLCVLGLVFSAVVATLADSELGEGEEDMSAWVVMVLVLVVLFCDSDRVGRGERSRASDVCERRMRLLGPFASRTLRHCHARRRKTRHPYHLGYILGTVVAYRSQYISL